MSGRNMFAWLKFTGPLQHTSFADRNMRCDRQERVGPKRIHPTSPLFTPIFLESCNIALSRVRCKEAANRHFKRCHGFYVWPLALYHQDCFRNFAKVCMVLRMHLEGRGGLHLGLAITTKWGWGDRGTSHLSFCTRGPQHPRTTNKSSAGTGARPRGTGASHNLRNA